MGDPCRQAHLVYLLLARALPAQPLLVHAAVQVVLTALGQKLADPRQRVDSVQGAQHLVLALRGTMEPVTRWSHCRGSRPTVSFKNIWGCGVWGGDETLAGFTPRTPINREINASLQV